MKLFALYFHCQCELYHSLTEIFDALSITYFFNSLALFGQSGVRGQFVAGRVAVDFITEDEIVVLQIIIVLDLQKKEASVLLRLEVIIICRFINLFAI